MQANVGITAIRRQTKRLVAQPSFRWLGKPARRTWYLMRMTSELARLPAVLLQWRRSDREKPTPELVDFAFEAFDGLFRPFQNKVEIRRLVDLVHSHRPCSIVEIGTARGGTLFLLSCAADPSARIVSVDLPAGQFGGGYPAWKGWLYGRLMGEDQSLHLIRANSHQQETFEETRQALGGRAADLLFIDGDHGYAGAKEDFIRYRTLVRPGGLIVFHDILESRIDKEITVAPLWREIARDYETTEIVDSYDQGQFGIGVVTAPETWKPA
jgi:predicted O-methyltransferase YrrM